MDYGGILEAVVTALTSDATLTNMLAIRTIGGVSSRSNSILYTGVIGYGGPFPVLILREAGLRSKVRPTHELPMGCPELALDVTIVADSEARRPIQGRLDVFLERAFHESGMDTATWRISDIDTSGSWVVVPMPKEPSLDQLGDLEMASKTYVVSAASKTVT